MWGYRRECAGGVHQGLREALGTLMFVWRKRDQETSQGVRWICRVVEDIKESIQKGSMQMVAVGA